MATPILHFNQMKVERPDLNKLAAEYDSLLSRLSSGGDLLTCFKEWNQIRDNVGSQYSLAYVLATLNTNNETHRKDRTFFEQSSPNIEEWDVDVIRHLLAHPSFHKLEEQYGPQLRLLFEGRVRKFDPAIIGHLKREKELETAYAELIASMSFTFRGEQINLSTLDRHFLDQDRAIRYEAHKVRADAFEKASEELDRIFDDLVAIRTEMAHILGFSNFIELGYQQLARTGYGPQQVSGFRSEVIKEVLPRVAQIREKQRRNLGVDRLMYWDEPILDTLPPPKPLGGDDWVLERTREMYHRLSSETGHFTDLLLKNGYLDVRARPGKEYGGYCTSFATNRMPFIFANFEQCKVDVYTMVHEMGHAFQYWLSSHHDFEELRYPTGDACEVHAIGMEYLTFPYMSLFFGSEAERYREQHLVAKLKSLPYICMGDEFQHEVYANPKWSPVHRRKVWQDLEAKYGLNTNYGDLSYWEQGGLWQRQLHFYQIPFLFIDYGLAEVCAWQLLARSKDDRDSAWEDYSRLCRSGGTCSFLEMLKIGKLESPLQPGVLKKSLEDIHDA